MRSGFCSLISSRFFLVSSLSIILDRLNQVARLKNSGCIQAATADKSAG